MWRYREHKNWVAPVGHGESVPYRHKIDGLLQERRNPIANVLELRLLPLTSRNKILKKYVRSIT